LIKLVTKIKKPAINDEYGLHRIKSSPTTRKSTRRPRSDPFGFEPTTTRAQVIMLSPSTRMIVPAGQFSHPKANIAEDKQIKYRSKSVDYLSQIKSDISPTNIKSNNIKPTRWPESDRLVSETGAVNELIGSDIFLLNCHNIRPDQDEHDTSTPINKKKQIILCKDPPASPIGTTCFRAPY